MLCKTEKTAFSTNQIVVKTRSYGYLEKTIRLEIQLSKHGLTQTELDI